MGAQRWIDIKIFKFQPSELAKLFLPAFIVYYLQGEHETAQFTFKTLYFLKRHINEFKMYGKGCCAEWILTDLCDFLHYKYPIYDDHLRLIFEQNGLKFESFQSDIEENLSNA